VAGIPWTWMAMGWLRKPRVFNMAHNGHFHEAAKLLGWVWNNNNANSGVTTEPPVVAESQQAASGSYAPKPKGVTWTNTGGPILSTVPNPSFPQGPPFMTINVAAATEGGNQFLIYRRFRKGVVYTMRFIYSTSKGADVVTAKLGSYSGASLATETPGGSTTAELCEFTWQPSADFDIAVASIAIKHATEATAIKVASVEVFEGTTRPSGITQENGRGAMPPVGVIQATASNKVNDSNVAALNGKLFNTGTHTVKEESAGFPESEFGEYAGKIADGGLSGYGVSQLAWWVDPSLIATPDDYAQGQLSVEYFWKGVLTGSQSGSVQQYLTNPRLTLFAIPEPAVTAEGIRYTPEYGSVGKQVPQAIAETTSLGSGINGLRVCRIGTIDFPITQQNPVRWLLVLSLEWSAALLAIFGTYQLLGVPAAQRITLPTGKSRTDGTYPVFQALYQQEAQKIIRSGLRGQNRLVGPAGLGPGALAGANESTGVTGTPMDSMPNNPLATATDLLAILHMEQLVPDDPSGEPVSTLNGKATVHYSFTPRYRLARPS
jgi:hypothetical protein